MAEDPRFTRSARALADAVLDLAAERPVELISVTEIARRAGVTRATFYNHANSPAALLAQTVEAELDEIRGHFMEGAGAHPEAVERVWRLAELEVVEHVLSHAEVYRVGLAPAAGAHGSVLADVLAHHLEEGLLAYASARSPGIADQDSTRLAMAAAFVSQGTVGALRAWLVAPGPHEAEFAVDWIVAMVPGLWSAFEAAPSS